MQQAINFDAPRTAAIAGMTQAGDHAESVAPGWKDRAYEFLRNYCFTHASFISEDVSDASKVAGMDQPPTDRAWGSVYIKAARAGIIQQAGIGRSRRRHGSVCPRWASRLYGMAEHAA